ncbi:hypothetical protein Q5P01_021711 [Channa striata]|uniref:Uncharacterized protein n=1 Tax=Channa striata TaxID=64152 RepID=A0AA88LUU9_CHASR|nr:hypothetical protein Q5P01_021711 [Channa striata]
MKRVSLIASAESEPFTEGMRHPRMDGLRHRIEKKFHHRTIRLVSTTSPILTRGGETTSAKLICWNDAD